MDYNDLGIISSQAKKEINHHRKWVLEWTFFCILFIILFWLIYFQSGEFNLVLPLSFSLTIAIITTKLIHGEFQSIEKEKALIKSIEEEYGSPTVEKTRKEVRKKFKQGAKLSPKKDKKGESLYESILRKTQLTINPIKDVKKESKSPFYSVIVKDKEGNEDYVIISSISIPGRNVRKGEIKNSDLEEDNVFYFFKKANIKDENFDEGLSKDEIDKIILTIRDSFE